MSDFYDPLFSKKDKKLETTASHVEEASFGYTQAFVGGISGPKIPVAVDSKNRLCFPVKE